MHGYFEHMNAMIYQEILLVIIQFIRVKLGRQKLSIDNVDDSLLWLLGRNIWCSLFVKFWLGPHEWQ